MSSFRTIASVLVILMFVLLPFGLIVASVPAQPYTVIAVEPFREAAIAAGVKICNETDTLWNAPGAMGGKTYVLSDNCGAMTPGNTIVVSVQKFDSVDSRDGAIRLYYAQTVNHAGPLGNVFVYGQYIAFVQASKNSEVVKKIADELRKEGYIS